MIEVIGDEEGSLIFYCYNMLFVFFQSHLRIFFSYPLHCWQKGYQKIFKLINFFSLLLLMYDLKNFNKKKLLGGEYAALMSALSVYACIFISAFCP